MKTLSIPTITILLAFFTFFLWTNTTFSQAKLEVKSTGEVQLNYSGINNLELRDGATLKGYIQHDGTNFKFYNNSSGTVILGTNSTNRLYIANNGNIKLGGGTPDSKAILDITGSGKGLLIPRTDTSAFSGLITEGMLIYDTMMSKFTYYNGAKWIVIGGSSELSDNDNDTKVLVEQSLDEDTIRFFIGGTEHFKMDASGHLGVLNTGGSVFIGEEAGKNDDGTNNRNVAIGHNALSSNMTGAENTALGVNALKMNEGGHNTAIGSNSLLDNVSGEYNVAMGESALEHGTGHHNVAIGPFSLLDNVVGNYNTTLGADAGKRNTGSENVFLGFESGKNNYGTGNVFVGHKVGRNMGGDSLLMIDNSSNNTPLIWGDFKTDSLVINGSLEVKGQIKITGGTPGADKVLTSDADGLAVWAAPAPNVGNYGTVTNSVTGQTWLDRNLGASQVATSSTDTLAYGDLYQWGRAQEGHEGRSSVTQSSQASSWIAGTSNIWNENFIIGNSDWQSIANDELWKGTDAENNPCPCGFRIPTNAELNQERRTWASNDAAGAYGSILKLPKGGSRDDSGDLIGVGSAGYYWSSTGIGNNEARYMIFGSGYINMAGNFRVFGYSVRCIKD